MSPASGMGRSEVETCLVNLYIYIYIYSHFSAIKNRYKLVRVYVRLLSIIYNIIIVQLASVSTNIHVVLIVLDFFSL